jgi:hypothetical protein
VLAHNINFDGTWCVTDYLTPHELRCGVLGDDVFETFLFSTSLPFTPFHGIVLIASYLHC